MEWREGDRQADAGWVVFWNVRVYASVAVCLLMLLFSRCYWCYRYLIWALFLLLFSFLRLSQLFSKRFNLAFVRHATRFAKAQLRSRGYCFARHLSYASVCRVHGSSNFRSCKQRIRVRFLKAMDLGVQRLEDFKEKFPSTFDARQPRFRFGCFGDRFVHFRSKRRNEPSARGTFTFLVVVYQIVLFVVVVVIVVVLLLLFAVVVIIQVVLSSFVKRRQEGRKYVWRQFLHAFLAVWIL